MTSLNLNSCPLIKDKGNGGVNENKAFAHMIASEIVEDIVDNAMEILLNKSNSQNCQKFNKIDTDAGGILEDIMSTNIGDNNLKMVVSEMKIPSDSKMIDHQSETTLREKVSSLKRNTLENTKRLTNFVRHPKNTVTKLVANHDAKASTSSDNCQVNREEVLGDCKQSADILDLVDLKNEEDNGKEKGENFNETGDKIKTEKKRNIVRRLIRYFQRNSLKIENPYE